MTAKTGLLGYPVAQSKSPLIHDYWMKQHGIDGTYEAMKVINDHLPRAVQALKNHHFKGFNITVPHKENIMALCDEIDDTARAIGAVNTVVIDSDKVIGRNTDAFGFIENMNGFDVRGKTVLVLGAGGAAKAALYGLQQAGAAKIILTNRTRAKAEAMQDNNIEILDWDKKESALNAIDLLVNTTSLGMAGKPPLEINLTTLNPSAHVYDIVYAPLMPPLLTTAKAQGNPVITGIGMLLHQARPAFKSWHGIMPEVDEALLDLVLL